MGSTTLRTTFFKFLIVRNSYTSKVYQGGYSRQLSSSAYDSAAGAAKTTVNETMKVGSDLNDKATCGAHHAMEKAKDAEEVSEKVKQTKEEALESAKDAAQKMKDAMAGKTEDSKAAIKQNAETITRSMNSKN